jgi:hypothetical protein
MGEGSSLDRFFGLFRGNREFYVRHQAPFTEKEGKITAASCGFAKDPDTNEFLPVTRQLFKDHLNGGDGLAISPLMNMDDERNVCLFAVIDIDVYDVNYTSLVRRLYDCKFKFAAFLSKSGGLHLYFLFARSEPAAEAIQALTRIVETFALKKLFPPSKVEIFPKQAAYTPGETVANCLFLPFYNAVNKSRQNMLTADGKQLPINKALAAAEGMHTSVKEIGQALDGLPYNDAPFCVQAILLSGALAENSGRNDFLFTAALYFKLKSPDDVGEELRKANAFLEAPLDEAEVDRIADSVSKNNYQIWGRCKKSPCAEHCDRKICRTREFGVGRGKNNMVSNVEFGKITRMLSEEPYYLWEARLAGTEAYTQVRIDGEADLLNQKVVQKACIRYLNQTPVTVKQIVWEKTLNDCLSEIEELEVEEGTDTTELSALRSCFFRFLTHKRTQNGLPHLILTGQVYYRDGVFYFTSEGARQYLAVEKFNLKGYNLREQLISYGCSKAELSYRTPRGTERTISCWQKPEDGELQDMGLFYDDIYDGDADILRGGSPDKEEAGYEDSDDRDGSDDRDDGDDRDDRYNSADDDEDLNF